MGDLVQKELGPYVLKERIAVGGMAEIYLAKSSGVAGFEKLLCLKVIHPDYVDDDQFIEMLIDEAKIAVSLNHANIAQIFDLGREGKIYYIAMEYIDGADLFQIMRALSEMAIDVPLDVAAYIGQEICTGLDYAHRKQDQQGRSLGIIHRDISPQNILISHSGEVKIIDFGIAKAAGRGGKTQAGVLKGKYYYMSPEQAWGDPIDSRTDIFSAGIVLYEVLTGQMLYLEEDIHLLMDMVRKAEIPPPSAIRPDIPEMLDQALMKALAHNPEERWQTANQLQGALASFLYSYTSDFTPERLSALLQIAEEHMYANPAPEDAPSSTKQEVPSPRDRAQVTARGKDMATARKRVKPVSLMSRMDFRRDTSQSMVFKLEDLMDTSGSQEIDFGEKTVVSAPPDMPPAPGDTAVEEEPIEELTEYVIWEGELEEGASLEEAQGEMEEAQGESSIDREVIVPLSEQDQEDDEDDDDAPTKVSNSPALRMQDMNLVRPRRSPDAPMGMGFNDPLTLDQTRPTPSPTRPAQTPRPAPAPRTPAPTARPSHSPHTPTPTPRPAPAPRTPAPHAPVQTPRPAPAPRTPAARPWPGSNPAMDSGWPVQGIMADLLQEENADRQARRQRRRRRRIILFVVMSVLAVASIAAGTYFLAFRSVDQQGIVEIISIPEGAAIRLDGQRLGKITPFALPIPRSGPPHVLELELTKYQKYRRKFSLPADEPRLRIYANLRPLYGNLHVRATPAGADVYINGDLQGQSPLAIEDLPTSETITLEVRKAGYKSARQSLEWGGRNYLFTEITLTKER